MISDTKQEPRLDLQTFETLLSLARSSTPKDFRAKFRSLTSDATIEGSYPHKSLDGTYQSLYSLTMLDTTYMYFANNDNVDFFTLIHLLDEAECLDEFSNIRLLFTTGRSCEFNDYGKENAPQSIIPKPTQTDLQIWCRKYHQRDMVFVFNKRNYAMRHTSLGYILEADGTICTGKYLIEA